MKKLCLYLVLLPCLLLTACGTRDEEKLFRDFSESLNARHDLSFVGKLRAEYPDRSVEFQLHYEEKDDCAVVTVLAPELISELSVEIHEGESVLEYNSLVIDTGALDDDGLSPLTALPAIAKALRTGYIDAVREEGGELVFTLIPDDGVKAEVWFEPSAMTPLHAELISGGKVTVYCDIESWR